VTWRDRICLAIAKKPNGTQPGCAGRCRKKFSSFRTMSRFIQLTYRVPHVVVRSAAAFLPRYERRMNKRLAALSSETNFVENCLKLENLPAVPPYWKRMRKMNQQGPALLGTLAESPALPADEFERLASEDAKILDCRSPEAFAAHIPGAINVGLGSSFATWAGTALPGGASIVLVLDSKRDLWEVCWQLLRIGYDLPKGWLSGGMMAWRTAARPLEILPQSTVWDLHRRMEENPQLLILDVRQPGGMERESHRGRSAHYRSRAAEPD
jgi:hydroxyacylglutathione hydrolase